MGETLDIKGYVPGFTIKIDGSELDAVTYKSILSISLSKKMDQADNFSFRVQDKMEGGQLKLMNSKKFSLGKKVNASIGYHGGKMVEIQGHIEVVTPQFSDGEIHTFDVSGKDKALGKLAVESGYKCYTKKKDSDIVKAIAGEVGLTPKVDTTTGQAPEKKEKKGGTSNLLFIKKMVRQNKGFEFFVSGGKLFFRKSKIQSSPIKTLEWQVHLTGFEPRKDLTNIITGVIVRWWDEKKREAITGEARASDEIALGSGKTAGKIAQEVYGDNKKIISDEPVDSPTEAKNIAISVLCDNNKELVTAECKSIGMPEIEPGEVIEIKGVEKSYTGKYYIYAARHTIDGQGYKTEFNIRRNT
jgi:phage protein D